MADELFDVYLGNKKLPPAADSPLLDQYLSPSNTPDKIIAPPVPTPANIAAGKGLKQGLADVSDTLDLALQPTVGKLLSLPPTEEKRKERSKQFEKELGDNPYASIGRVGGQVLASAPFVPAGGIASTFGAKVGAPLANRLGAIMATGLAGGGVYGGLTSSTNDEGVAQNIASGAGAGLVGAPLVAAAGKLGSMIIPSGRSLAANYSVLKAANAAGVPASAMRNVIQRLEDAGYTPQQAQLELSRLGSKATLADLSPSLQTEASGLASFGGKPTTILKERFAERGLQANNEATNLIGRILGPKPDLHQEIENIQKAVAPDYAKAKASGTNLNVSGIIDHIDNELVNAVGSESNALKAVKSYLYWPEDKNGNKLLKNDVTSLHKVRIALDGMIETLKNPSTSQGKNTLNAVQEVRSQLDNELKSIPEMRQADEKFSKIVSGLQIGKDALTTKTNKDDFVKDFNRAAPETQEAIRKGILDSIYNLMDRNEQGEGASLRRLFNKKVVNQEIMRTAFGTRGESALDEIHNEVAQRLTENKVQHGAQTAERLAVQARYGQASKPSLDDLGIGPALDVLGAGGMATASTLLKRGLTNRLIARSENKLGQLTEGTADLLSRQGAERDSSLRVLDQINNIQNKLKAPTAVERFQKALPRLPTLAAPFGGKAYSEVKNKI